MHDQIRIQFRQQASGILIMVVPRFGPCLFGLWLSACPKDEGWGANAHNVSL